MDKLPSTLCGRFITKIKQRLGVEKTMETMITDLLLIIFMITAAHHIPKLSHQLQVFFYFMFTVLFNISIITKPCELNSFS